MNSSTTCQKSLNDSWHSCHSCISDATKEKIRILGKELEQERQEDKQMIMNRMKTLERVLSKFDAGSGGLDQPSEIESVTPSNNLDRNDQSDTEKITSLDYMETELLFGANEEQCESQQIEWDGEMDSYEDYLAMRWKQENGLFKVSKNSKDLTETDLMSIIDENKEFSVTIGIPHQYVIDAMNQASAEKAPIQLAVASLWKKIESSIPPTNRIGILKTYVDVTLKDYQTYFAKRAILHSIGLNESELNEFHIEAIDGLSKWVQEKVYQELMMDIAAWRQGFQLPIVLGDLAFNKLKKHMALKDQLEPNYDCDMNESFCLEEVENATSSTEIVSNIGTCQLHLIVILLFSSTAKENGS